MPPLCICIISQIEWFVKREIEIFFNFFRSVIVSAASPNSGATFAPQFALPLDTLIVSQFGRFAKGFVSFL